MKVARVTNEKKNLNRLAGEFLVASRLTQRGYMVTLQWGTTIGYDILVFDKAGNVAFLEVKSSAQYSRRWILQKKYAEPNTEAIPLYTNYKDGWPMSQWSGNIGAVTGNPATIAIRLSQV